MLALTLTTLCSLTSSGAVTAAAPAAPDTPWEIWAGVSGGVRSAQGSPTGSGLLAADRQVGRYFRPEVQVGLAAYGGGFQVGSRIRIGTEILYPRTGVVPSLWIAFA